jgi:hypothetical protein
MFKAEDIKTYHRTFSKAERDTIRTYLDRGRWSYGNISSKNGYQNAPPFWGMVLKDEEFFTEHLFQKVQEIVGEELTLDDCYCNGSVYGTGGQPHVDAYDERGRTFLWYANEGWDIRWNGKTVFLFDEGPQFIVPEINKSIYFPGMVKHFSEETTRTFGGMRKTLVWKTQLK